MKEGGSRKKKVEEERKRVGRGMEKDKGEEEGMKR